MMRSENFKDIFISPDLTRKQAEEDRKLRLKLKEIRMKKEVLDGVKIIDVKNVFYVFLF